MADGARTVETLRERFGDAVTEFGDYRGQHWARIPADRLREIAAFLRDELGYDHLVDVTAVHWPEQTPAFEAVYHLYAYERGDRVRLKVPVPESGGVPSLADLWKSADWNERETYDMFGVTFDGHPDLRRILMPDDYTDFPLRKEFPLYRG